MIVIFDPTGQFLSTSVSWLLSPCEAPGRCRPCPFAHPQALPLSSVVHVHEDTPLAIMIIVTWSPEPSTQRVTSNTQGSFLHTQDLRVGPGGPLHAGRGPLWLAVCGDFSSKLDPSPRTASTGELRERCTKIGRVSKQENTRECLFICLLIFVRVPKEKKENKEPR